MEQTKEIQAIMQELRLGATAEAISELIQTANTNEVTYGDFVLSVMKHEQQARFEKARLRHLKWATLPYQRSLNEFNLTVQPALNQKQMSELRTLNWVDQSYNLILLGPTGVGKTFLSIGLCVEAIDSGYNAIFITMGDLVRNLKTETVSRQSQMRLRRLYKADLIVLDDLMFMALDKQEANLFFHFINKLYEQTSFIITSNKSPDQWGETIGDEIITGAFLDRIIQKSQVIELVGEGYRVTHRQTIFNE
ncbi:IS21-like element helper ATPase IstB [Loigolactobacillus backii]|uniref:ATP-binding protein n=1 Tax=Loigolactobacillus backii TaxID=375175 RepID=A0A192H0H4_9LACO|nr:IS21-like element helper ATPase IstB [Loigolactobacillus backii]ANK61855.1 ATP-binding protein [Loigolactobacillus backii]ANK68951.1 ATP-binding protein [Loigolactobacillus backii]MDA5387485.1 IS21-like element helper ATPase IstB [Loigolactobacillus backii]MDA5390031.1 IS21-like element helper ATPase IstB [Loigolactobacillus backii]PIO82371.1 ATP-binding protein [Loigolactobacillus backii]